MERVIRQETKQRKTWCGDDYKNVEYGGNRPYFGIAVLCPVLLSILSLVPHWWRKENTLKKRLLTAPFMLLNFWPQYRNIRILYYGLWKQDKRWRIENEHCHRDISSNGNITCHRFHILCHTLTLI